MKALIKREIAQENKRDKPDVHYLRQLKDLLAMENITMKAWVNTGRFVNKTDFISDNPQTPLHKDCSDVIKYAGLFVIQGLKTGGFFVDMDSPEAPPKFDVLEEAEDYLWNTKVKLINN